MWIGIIIISMVLAYLLRIVIITNKFKRIGIKLSITDSIKILFILTKNYVLQLTNLKKENHKKQLKILNRIFWFYFDTLLVSLTSILKNALELQNNKDKVSVIQISSGVSIVKNVNEVLPYLNESMASAA